MNITLFSHDFRPVFGKKQADILAYEPDVKSEAQFGRFLVRIAGFLHMRK